MKLSIAVKSGLASFLYSLGLIQYKLKRISGTGFVVLMYHRVMRKHNAKTPVQSGLFVEPGTLRIHLSFLKKFFRVTPISTLFLDLAKGSHRSDSRPPCVLTFDDGWYDFYEQAFPILKAHVIPATVFLPTNFIGTGDWFWTDRLSYVLNQRKSFEGLVSADPSSTNPLIGQLTRLTGSQESKLERAISLLKTHREEEIQRLLSDLAMKLNLNLDPPGRAFLSWQEVKEMACSGLISFGSHTASHRILTTLTDEEIQDELTKSKERLIAENVVDPSFIPFSYPNGNYTRRIARMAKEAGYSLAVTTEKGWNGPESDRFCIRRIGLHEDMTSTEAMFGCRIAKIF